MLLYVYLFALVLGGVLLTASVIAGGDADADVDADVDVDVDADVDAEAGHAAHGGGADAGGSLAGVFSTMLSLRFWTFFAAFFGLTGAILDGADLVEGQLVPLIAAIGMGWGAGFATVRLLEVLHRGESGRVATSADYVGKTGRVLLAFGPQELGKVRLEIGGTTVDVLAKTDDAQPFTAGEEALVVEMHDHTAFVARIGSPSSEA